MQECIENLAEGIFQYSIPQIELSEKKLIINVEYGENKLVSFDIKTLEGKIAEGYVYTSEYRMNCQTPHFCGRESVIRFEFNSKGLEAGSLVEGDICIVSNAGEYCLPFVVSVEEKACKDMDEAAETIIEQKEDMGLESNSVEEKIRTDKPVTYIDREHIEYRKNLMALLSEYCDFRLHKKATSIWAKESLNIVSRILSTREDDKWFLLIKAQLLIARKQYQEAQWILVKFESNKSLKAENEEMYAYFQYICTLIEKEPVYVKKIRQEIEELYKKNDNSWIILWILFYIDERFENDSIEKYHYIEKSIEAGGNNVLILVEAALLLLKEPLLLSKYGDTEKKILAFMYRNNCMNESLAMQFMGCVARLKVFDSITYKICEMCCEDYPSKENISSMCGYLIRTDMYGTEYLKWYSKGIEEELRLTGLYEYYAMSVDTNNYDPLPKIVYMYFRYNSNINNKKKAYIYANLIKNKEAFPEIYRGYEKNINDFMLFQLQRGIISLDMSVIYNEFLHSQMITEDCIFSLIGIIDSFCLKCDDERFSRVTVHYKKLKTKKSYSIIKGQAYIQLCSKEYELVFSDIDGNAASNEVEYELTKLLDEKAYFLKCLKMAPSSSELLVYYFENEDLYSVPDYDKTVLLYNAIMSYEIADEYKTELRSQMIDYYYRNDFDANFDVYIGNMLFYKLKLCDRSKYIELLLKRRIYDKGYNLITEYGFESIKVEDLVVMCNHVIETTDFVEDEFLLSLSYYVFSKGKYNELIIRYLVKYYYGSIHDLNNILKAANMFNVDTHELKERIITQMLYTQKHLKHADSIFADYCREGAKDLIKNAYLSYFAHGYFVRQQLISQRIIEYISKEYAKGNDLNDICKLALLKAWSEKQVLNEFEEVAIDEILDEFENKGIFFSFFIKFPRNIIEKYSFSNRLIVEYYSNPKSNVEIKYLLNNGNYVSEPMKKMFPGIFVKDFQLFYGEKLQYYISEMDNDIKQVVESGELVKSDLSNQDNTSAYERLNDIMLSYIQQEEKTLIDMMKDYEQKKKIVETMFHKL